LSLQKNRLPIPVFRVLFIDFLRGLEIVEITGALPRGWPGTELAADAQDAHDSPESGFRERKWQSPNIYMEVVTAPAIASEVS